MSFLGIFVAIGAAISESWRKECLNTTSREYSDRSGTPYYDDYKHGGCIYIPTGEHCYMRYDPSKKERYLVNSRTNRVVFNITKWEKDRDTAKKIRELKEELREKNLEWFIPPFEGRTFQGYDHLLLNVDMVRLKYQLRGTHTCYEYDAYFDSKGELVKKNQREITRKEFDDSWAKSPVILLKFPKSASERKKMWEMG